MQKTGRARHNSRRDAGGGPVFHLDERLIVPALILYVVAEAFVCSLVAAQVGFFLTFVLAMVKSVFGFAFVLAFMRGALMRLARGEAGLSSPGGIGRRILGGVLLILPGFFSGLLGLALWAPGAAQVPPATRPPGPMRSDGVVDLESDEWREVPVKKIARRRRAKHADEAGL